ncbi:hypothetical protein M23134_08091 [Microscilla marina ATCC 23134]|uniref:Uncharacterized protein n=1 Tax=Microscilla marina ATCC 23134 TaxID=313606 RepID=A1ZGZ8_MICM2|nr:hypothetical protein M23134_08091 [Microscilla marina ATCC 23134]
MKLNKIFIGNSTITQNIIKETGVNKKYTPSRCVKNPVNNSNCTQQQYE